MSQLELFDTKEVYDPAFHNPMVVMLGKGPEGKKCTGCQHFYRKEYGNYSYFKCALRGDTKGPGTDHRAGYHACSKFEEVDPWAK